MAKIADAAHVEYRHTGQVDQVVHVLNTTRLDNYGTRSRLKALSKFGRLTYVGTYVRCGYKTDDEYGDTFYPTILLDNLTCHGVKVTSHLWLTYNDGFRKIGRLKPGDKVSLTGTVGSYYKGYYMDPIEDYQLGNVQDVTLVSSKHQHYPLPENTDLVVGYTMVKNESFYLSANRPYSPDLVGEYDKWAQQNDKAMLPEVSSAEKDAQRYQPLPIGYSNQSNRLLRLDTKKRYTFTGVYMAADYDSFMNHYTPTIEINDIRLGNSIVCNNLWFNYNKTFLKLNQLHTGDTIQFDARVKVATKNKGLSGETKYYKLGYPTQAKLLRKKYDKLYRYPFPHETSDKDVVVGYIMKEQNHGDNWDTGAEAFRIKLWDRWILDYKLGQLKSDSHDVKHLAEILQNYELGKKNFEKDSTNFTGSTYVTDLIDYLHRIPSLAKRVHIKIYDNKIINLSDFSIMTWSDLWNRTLRYLRVGYISDDIKNPFHDKLHLHFKHGHAYEETLFTQILLPLVRHNFGVYFYLTQVKSVHDKKLDKLCKKAFKDYKLIFHITHNFDPKMMPKEYRTCVVHSLRILRDNKSKYSKIHLSQVTVREIKEVLKFIQDDYLNKLTPRQKLNDFRKAGKYLDCPIIKK